MKAILVIGAIYFVDKSLAFVLKITPANNNAKKCG